MLLPEQPDRIHVASDDHRLVTNPGLILTVPLARSWAAGAGPGDDPLTIDLDSTVCETFGLAKGGRAAPPLRQVEEPVAKDTVP